MKLVGIITILLAMSVASAAIAMPTITCTVNNLGSTNQYNYTLKNTGLGDIITCLHIYSPTNTSSILSGWADVEGWEYSVDVDPYTGGSDIYWYMPEELGGGLADTQTLSVHFTTSAAVPTINGFVPPDCLGNWGFDSLLWADYGTVVMDSSVSVPGVAAPASVPEPASLLILGAGCALLKLRRRK